MPKVSRLSAKTFGRVSTRFTKNPKPLLWLLVFIFAGLTTLLIGKAAVAVLSIEPETKTIAGNASGLTGGGASANGYVKFGNAGQSAYQQHLSQVLGQTFRNKNHDNSPFINTKSVDLPTDDNSPLLGPRSEYLNRPGGGPENHFSDFLKSNPDQDGGGEFRTSCEFSHFSYDDPLVYPNQPRKAHLHMFFGNTHVNAYSTYDSLINSGSSTCNGQELNRTGYWVPAMFDAQGYVRIPERVVLYYKGYGLAKKSCGFEGGTVCSDGAIMYPERMALVVNQFASDFGDAGYNQGCSTGFISDVDPGANRTIPYCQGQEGTTWNNWMFPETRGDSRATFAHILKMPNCWNGQDPSNWNNFAWSGSWFYSPCDRNAAGFTKVLPNLEYKIHYPLNGPSDNTAGWYLSSDVNKTTFVKGTGGATVHADWWGGWNKKINREFLDNCVLVEATPTDNGPDCGNGYLSDGGDNRNDNPLPGRALKFRPQFTGGYRVHASEIYNQLCKPYTNRQYTKPEDAAWCTP